MNSNIKIRKLIYKGVNISKPNSIEVGTEVDINRISSDGVVIYPGCRVFGASTSISSGVHLGAAGPVTIENCNIARNVKLMGGYFKNSVFMDGVSAGLGCHVRSGTILEEHSVIAHNVGLKQTILFPFVRIGSLVNFCDCFMAGGTSNKNHSEVGSSYVHFNYTPNQDKATPSLIGDVAHGVMLNQDPIFLGGQGGLVGPCRIAYGTVIPAGFIQRKDQLKKNRLTIPRVITHGSSVKYTIGVYQNLTRQVVNNIIYIANLLSLMCWYRNIRSMFITDSFDMFIFSALIQNLQFIIKERVDNFIVFCNKFGKPTNLHNKEFSKLNRSSTFMQQKKELFKNSHDMIKIVDQFLDKIDAGDLVDFDFVSSITDQISTKRLTYIDVIRSLNSNATKSGTMWLQSIVKKIVDKLLKLFPSIS